MKIPNSLIPEVYSFSKKVFENKLSLKEAQEYFVGDNRINPNSAADYFHDFKYLLQGKKFARTLNAYSMDYFISSIYKDYGIDGLQNALKALKLHIEYYEEHQKTTMHKMREIHEKYSRIMQNAFFNDKVEPIHSPIKHILINDKKEPSKADYSEESINKFNEPQISSINIARDDIEEVVNKYTQKINPEHRYASFDYCYNYFYTTVPNDLNKDIEKSCYTLGFYLASWGMLRPSSFLLNKSAKCFESTIHYIASLDKSVWKIDVDTYPENIDVILNIYNGIKDRLIKNGNADLTLITKILLGVFGFVPAFDNYFCNEFRGISGQDCRFKKVDKESLEFIQRFYLSNKSSIDRLSAQIFTIDFMTGHNTKNNYTKAKIIDMYGFTLKSRDD